MNPFLSSPRKPKALHSPQFSYRQLPAQSDSLRFSLPLSPLFPAIKGGKQKVSSEPLRVHNRVISFPALQAWREGRRAEEGKGLPELKSRRRNAMKKDFVGVVAVSAKSEKGRGLKAGKEFNQDSYLVTQNFLGTPDAYLLSLSDGHGVYGHCVSGSICQCLPSYLTAVKGLSASELQREVPEMMREAAKKLQKNVTKASGYSAKFSGATLVAVLIQDRTLICANIGDSRAMLVQAGEDDACWGWKQITTDHKPDLITERHRIETMQGHVEPLKTPQGTYIGPARVWIPGEDAPGLAMSRSIGDELAHTVGVSEVPEVLVHTLTSRDRAVIIASDGLWDVLSNTEVAMIVQRQWTNCDMCCLELLTTASNRWKRSSGNVDDVTVIVATLTC